MHPGLGRSGTAASLLGELPAYLACTSAQCVLAASHPIHLEVRQICLVVTGLVSGTSLPPPFGACTGLVTTLCSATGRPLSGPFPSSADLSPPVWMMAYPLLTSSLVSLSVLYQLVLPTALDVHKGRLSPLQKAGAQLLAIPGRGRGTLRCTSISHRAK